MRLPSPPPRADGAASPARRNVLLNAFLAATAGTTLFGQAPLPALAAYTIVPSGTVAEKETRLLEVAKQFEKTPDDPYVFGEKAQLEADISGLRRNKAYASRMARDLASGEQRFLQGLTVNVPDMNAAVNFWKGGMGAQVLDERRVGGAKVTRVGFGSQSFGAEDGAKFALELVEAPGTQATVEGGVVEYLQMAMPVFRMSQVMMFGGDIVSAYGWTELVAPGGLPLRVRIDETRRDPFEFVALRTSSMERATAHLNGLGMSVANVKGGKKLNKKASFLTSNSIFEAEDATEPEREIGATLLTFDDPALCTGCLLLPPKKTKSLTPPLAPTQLRMVGGLPTTADGPAQTTNPDGLPTTFLTAEDFEAAVAVQSLGMPPAMDPAAIKGLPEGATVTIRAVKKA